MDAICINQSDVQEKNAQIPLMRQKYENGAETIIWLGDSSSWNAHLAFQLVLDNAKCHNRIVRAQAGAGAEAERRDEHQRHRQAKSMRSRGNLLGRCIGVVGTIGNAS